MKTLFMNGGSSARGIEKNIERVDAAFLEMSDIHAGHGHGTVRWPGLPAQPSDTVVTYGRAN
jgi:hypothetical protein